MIYWKLLRLELALTNNSMADSGGFIGLDMITNILQESFSLSFLLLLATAVKCHETALKSISECLPHIIFACLKYGYIQEDLAFRAEVPYLATTSNPRTSMVPQAICYLRFGAL
jgi:hypothetical protein